MNGHLRGELQPAEASYNRARDLQLDLLQQDRKSSYRQELARTHYNLGLVHQAMDRPQRAEDAFQASIAILQLLVDRDPWQDYRQGLARARFNLGSLMKGGGRRGEAGRSVRLDRLGSVCPRWPTHLPRRKRGKEATRGGREGD